MFLLLEDDNLLGSMMVQRFSDQGYTLHRTQTIAQAKLLLTRHHQGITGIILDRHLPDGEGISLVPWIKHHIHHHIPIIMLTSRTQIDDTLQGFAAGVDDYMGKPFDLRELLARLRARQQHQGDTFVSGDFRCHLKSKTASYQEKEVSLTAHERYALELLCNHQGDVVHRSSLIDTIWGGENRDAENNLDVLIAGLRKKIGKETIVTIRGIGYKIPR
ncbi:MAG: response regulator transcription factor [Candidatus Absconditabacterales bacterium]|nr:response regulator transcription factor [Candidatus Absconditabacterales bacterium]